LRISPRRALSRFVLLAGVLFGLRPAQAEAAPAPFPPAWIAYAGQVQEILPVWLGEESGPASRLRAYLAPKPSSGPVSILVKVWVDRDGGVSRIDFPSLLGAQADADLQSSLTGRRLPAPPAGLPMPIRLRIRFTAPDPAPSSAPG
jgi:hypothetical protein